MKTLEAFAFGDILPPSIAGDTEVTNIGMSLDNATIDVTEIAKELPILSRIDELSEDWLDLLAWQFHADMYSTDLTLAEKRALVKRLLIIHKYKGTPYAIQQALSAFEYDVVLDENTGEHHTFDAEIDALNEGADIGTVVSRAIAYINSAKGASRHLRTLKLSINAPDTNIYPAPATVYSQKLTVYPSEFISAEQGTVYAGALGYMDVEIEVSG